MSNNKYIYSNLYKILVIKTNDLMDHIQSWCLVLERTFLKFNWSEHAKKHTYTRRTYFTPEVIESLLLEYIRGGNPYIGEFNGHRPHNRIIKILISGTLLCVVVDISVFPLTIITYYYTQSEEEINEYNDIIN
jgi:hypothetical protein